MNRISNEAIIEKSKKTAVRELQLIDRNLQNLLDTGERYAKMLATESTLQDIFERKAQYQSDPIENLSIKSDLSKVLYNFIRPNTNVVSASFFLQNYGLFDTGNVDADSIKAIFGRDSVLNINKRQTVGWTSLFKLKYKSGEEDNTFAVTKSVISKETGKTTGIVALYIPEKEIASIYLNNRVNDNDKFIIVNEENVIVSSPDKADLYKKFEELSYLDKGTLISMEKDSSILTYKNNIQLLMTVHRFEKLNWKIISIIPLEEITTENKQISRLIIVIGLLCLFFAFITSYLLSYTVSRPILKLVKVMKAIKLGNLDKRADFNSSDEIGMLGEGFNNLMDKVERLMEEIYKEQKAKREYEFKLLQSQIKPHFLYNTIETIISFIKLDMKEEATLTAKNLASFYRVSLSKGNDIITIADEVLLTKSYLSIQKLRYVEYMDYEMEFDEEILNYSIPKLTLQPLVENSIYHGIKPKEEKGFLHIGGRIGDGKIIMEVYDNGVGMSQEMIAKALRQPAKSNKNVDFGVSSVDARYRLLYGNEYGLKIESEVGRFTKVTVMIPMLLKPGEANYEENINSGR